MQIAKKSISIIIPNYNGRKLLEDYVPHTIGVIEEAGVPYEIIVVDDCSKDESVNYIRSAYPNIRLIVNPVNKGFSYTCNQGIAVAQYELILLLNSDVKLMPGYFEHQWKYFLSADTFGVMGRIIDMEGDHIQDAARMPKFNGFKLKTSYFYYTDRDDDKLYTYYLSGANALIDAKKLKQIQGFYEIFSPFYCEDIELSLRAWRMGWKCYYEHRSVCRHQMSASTKNYQTAKWVKSVYYRNRFYLHALHLNGAARLGWFMQITFIDLLPRMLVGQWWLWKSYTALFKNHKEIKAYRNRLSLLSGIHKNVFDVVKDIRRSVINLNISRFKP